MTRARPPARPDAGRRKDCNRNCQEGARILGGKVNFCDVIQVPCKTAQTSMEEEDCGLASAEGNPQPYSAVGDPGTVVCWK